VALQAAFSERKFGDWQVVDPSKQFDNPADVLGVLTIGNDCNVALFDIPQKAFNWRHEASGYNYAVYSGSYSGQGVAVYSQNDVQSCAKPIRGMFDLVDEGGSAKIRPDWVAKAAAIEDCWKNHLECLTKKKLAYPSMKPDPFDIEFDGLGKLVDQGYCVTSGADAHTLTSGTSVTCNASNGNNIYGLVGAYFMLDVIASTSSEYASKIIAGDGWVLAFDSGFTDAEIDEVYAITGGRLISR
jgi:hypothetical protein